MKTQFEPAAGGFFLEIRISNIGFMNENAQMLRFGIAVFIHKSDIRYSGF